MAPPRSSFAELLKRFREGDRAATNRLFKSYNCIIRESVRRRLPSWLRPEFESIDFAQDVWTAICESRHREARFDDSNQLRSFLIEIAVNKVIDTYRRNLSLRRRPRVHQETLQTVPGPEPTPSQWAIAGERWRSIANGLPKPHVALVERIREGYSLQEVADMAGITPRTVTRILNRVLRLCEEPA